MDYRIFLSEYRVPTTKSAQWWEARRTHFTCEAEEAGSGKQVLVDVVPLFSLGQKEHTERERIAAALRQLRHRGVPAVQAFGVENGCLAVVTETVAGLSASEWVEIFGTIPVQNALGIGAQVANAWQATTRHGIPQAAIFPANLTIIGGATTEEGWPLVKLPRFFDSNPRCTGLDASPVMSSEIAAFASPERIAGAPMDFRSRVYSLGATLWFLISGEPPPFPALQVDQEGPLVPRQHFQLPGVSPSANRLLMRMMSPRRDQRPLDPIVLEGALRACLSELGAEEESTDAIPAAFPARIRAAPSRAVWRRLGMRLAATASAAAIFAVVWSAWSANEVLKGSTIKPVHQPKNGSHGDAAAKRAITFAANASFPEEREPEIQSVGDLPASGVELAPDARKSSESAKESRRPVMEANAGAQLETVPGGEMENDPRVDIAGSAALKGQR